MDLDYAIVADGVSSRPDGKVDIYGAGFDTILAPSAPAAHPRLVVAVRLLLSRHEMEHSHEVVVALQAADGAELARATGQLAPVPPELRDSVRAGRQGAVQLALNFENLVFPAFGFYQLVILWDGSEPRPAIRLQLAETPPTAT